MPSPRQTQADCSYIWDMIKEMDKLPLQSPELEEHKRRLKRIAWKLNALDYLEAKLKNIRTHKTVPVVSKKT